MDNDKPTVQRKLRQQNFMVEIGGFANTHWSARLDEDDSFDDAIQPEFWAHVAFKIDPVKGQGDLIWVRNHDASGMGVLIVRAVVKGALKVAWWTEPKLFGSQETVEDKALSIRWNVGRKRYEVLRESDRTIVKGDFALREDAVQWVADYRKDLAA